MNGNLDIARNLGLRDNVCIRVIDQTTHKVVSEHVGHNAATCTLLTGIGHFLMGEALSGGQILSDWTPQYISLGTMGLFNQEQDSEGLPRGVGDVEDMHEDEETRFTRYLEKCPGFGSDGYDGSLMNDRAFAGLGYPFNGGPDLPSVLSPINCELISPTFPRSRITYRQCPPESRSETPKTIEVIFSALISTGALAQFRDPGNNYIFISEVGLWSSATYKLSGLNGLLAGYRLCPPDKDDWDMSNPENRHKLKESILKVGTNQVVQVIWKIQLGAIEQLV